MNITNAFVDRIYGIAQMAIPQGVSGIVKHLFLDYLGVTYGGAYQIGSGLEDSFRAGAGVCTVLSGNGLRTDPMTAAFLNGFYAQTLELDDGHRFGNIHPGAVVISAVLAICEMNGLDYMSLERGMVVGYEAMARLAVAIQPGHKKRGYHATGTCGIAGAALGCAAALKMKREEYKSVLSAAMTSSAGLIEIQEDSSELKAYNTAHAALGGVAAALTGRAGLNGPEDILGGDRGFFSLQTDGADMEALIGSHTYYEIERVYFKPYVSCRHCHSALEAAIEIRKQLLRDGVEISPDAIEKISVDTYSLAIRGHDHTRIQGAQSAKLSLPYSVAVALFTGRCGIQEFEQGFIHNAELQRLVDKITVREDPSFSALCPGRRISSVTVTLRGGEVKSARVDYAKGEPENPMSEKDIIEKFSGIMEWCGETDKGRQILNWFDLSKFELQKLLEILVLK